MEKIETALDILKPGGLRLADKAAFERLCSEVAARHGKIGQKASSSVAAYINYSRWVADCPNCNAGMALAPGSNTVVCLECGERYDVTWPKYREAIETVLLFRPKRNRHWWPHETTEKLQQENDQHGVGECKDCPCLGGD